MTPDFKVGKNNKWFRQCVGIDIAKDKFNACLFMYDIASDMGCGTKSIEFKNTQAGLQSASQVGTQGVSQGVSSGIHYGAYRCLL